VIIAEEVMDSRDDMICSEDRRNNDAIINFGIVM
jgi:hypothetical protein